MSLLLEKCEIATHSIDNVQQGGFNDDAQIFVQQQLSQDKNMLAADQEVNDLVGFYESMRIYYLPQITSMMWFYYSSDIYKVPRFSLTIF